MTELAVELRSAALRWPMHDARLVRLVAGGRCPSAILQGVAARVFESAERFTGDLALLIEAAPNSSLRSHLLENLIEETGQRVVPGQGLELDPARVHLEWARSFARACGLDEDALRERISRLPRPAIRGFDETFAQEGWLGAAAYLLAQEANSPRTLEPMLRGLESLGFEPAALAFFRNHIEADARHGGGAFALLAREVDSDATRDRVLRCTARGALDWWTFHN